MACGLCLYPCLRPCPCVACWWGVARWVRSAEQRLRARMHACRAAAVFKRIAEAYEVLRDESLRGHYDSFGRHAFGTLRRTA